MDSAEHGQLPLVHPLEPPQWSFLKSHDVTFMQLDFLKVMWKATLVDPNCATSPNAHCIQLMDKFGAGIEIVTIKMVTFLC